MGFLGIGSDAGASWLVEFEGGRGEVLPGGLLRATARCTAAQPLEVRAVRAALSALEEYAYEVTEDPGRAGSRTDRRWQATELWRQEVELQTGGNLQAGESRAFPLEFAVPPDAAPTFESAVLRLRWRLAVWMDVGGRDPSLEQDVFVPVIADALAGAAPDAVAERVEGARTTPRTRSAWSPGPCVRVPRSEASWRSPSGSTWPGRAWSSSSRSRPPGAPTSGSSTGSARACAPTGSHGVR